MLLVNPTLITTFNRKNILQNLSKKIKVNTRQTWTQIMSLYFWCYELELQVNFEVVVIKLRSTRGSNCSSRAELARLES